ncbi:MAG: undecaprenyldiphospho-muramoylpentapeptide beta-N-acetylglucosaminyltransferase [Candidatus Dadabacteria bacterium]|nr:MAG: undecaprenyldiphospho-muramoylpentapeptide beta-N-acetylglucosaminyltransferase [Candidatus Dadabacteria bacterium]
MNQKHKHQPVKILIAASGSGGHLLPSRLVAEEIKQQCPAAVIEFIGSGRPLEKEIIEKYGFVVRHIDVVNPAGRSIVRLLGFSLSFFKSIAQSWNIISEFKPDVVVGMGGYVSIAPVIVARLRGVPVWIHEAELKAGAANRLLAYFATRISVAFEKTEIPCSKKVFYSGHPLRKELKTFKNMLVKETPVKNILILGGSQGAESFDKLGVALIPFWKEKNLSIWHQCRPDNQEMLKKAYAEAGCNARVESFIHDMAEAYSWSDLIISRAGAGAVMEIGVVNKPAILIPFPFAANNHQVDNARVLAERGKALLIIEEQGLEQKVKSAVLKLLNLKNYRSMQKQPVLNRSLNASEEIATQILTLAGTAAL